MLDCSSWFRHLTLGSCSPFAIIRDWVSVSNGERRRVISPWATIGSGHLNSGLCSTRHIYCFSTDSEVPRHLFLWAFPWMSQFGPEPHPLLVTVFQAFFYTQREKINPSQREFIPSKAGIEELGYTVSQECLPCSQRHKAKFIGFLWNRRTEGDSSHFKNRWCYHLNFRSVK